MSWPVAQKLEKWADKQYVAGERINNGAGGTLTVTRLSVYSSVDISQAETVCVYIQWCVGLYLTML